MPAFRKKKIRSGGEGDVCGGDLGGMEGVEPGVEMYYVREKEIKRKHPELGFCDSVITSDDTAA